MWLVWDHDDFYGDKTAKQRCPEFDWGCTKESTARKDSISSRGSLATVNVDDASRTEMLLIGSDRRVL